MTRSLKAWAAYMAIGTLVCTWAQAEPRLSGSEIPNLGKGLVPDSSVRYRYMVCDAVQQGSLNPLLAGSSESAVSAKDDQVVEIRQSGHISIHRSAKTLYVDITVEDAVAKLASGAEIDAAHRVYPIQRHWLTGDGVVYGYSEGIGRRAGSLLTVQPQESLARQALIQPLLDDSVFSEFGILRPGRTPTAPVGQEPPQQPCPEEDPAASIPGRVVTARAFPGNGSGGATYPMVIRTTTDTTIGKVTDIELTAEPAGSPPLSYTKTVWDSAAETPRVLWHLHASGEAAATWVKAAEPSEALWSAAPSPTVIIIGPAEPLSDPIIPPIPHTERVARYGF